MEFLLIASAHFLALLSPGPDFFLITRGALSLPLRYCIAICAGIATANGVYLLCAVCSLELVRESPLLMSLLHYLGASYLIFIGVMLIRSPRQSLENTNSEAGILNSHHLGRQFIIGFMSGILNPKNAIFYLSLFTVMVSETTPLSIRFFYMIWMMSVVLLWDCAIVFCISRQRIRTLIGSSVFYVEKFSGIMLTLFGITLSFT